VNWRALDGMAVIMLTPSLATVRMPEVPALTMVPGALTMLPGTALTNPVPLVTALSAKLVKAVGVLVRAEAPALRALLVALNAVKGTLPTVVSAPLPRLTTWPATDDS
jgi:hypothetical protein